MHSFIQSGRTALHEACWRYEDYETELWYSIIITLLEHGADITITDEVRARLSKAIKDLKVCDSKFKIPTNDPILLTNDYSYLEEQPLQKKNIKIYLGGLGTHH